MNDPISDMLIRIKNASKAGKESVSFSYSKIKHSIVELLHKEGYIENFSNKSKKGLKSIDVDLKYNNQNQNTPRIEEVKRISRPSKRIYLKSGDIKMVKRGFGLLVLSTPKGIISGKEARKEGVGGEALFEIY